jgi:hypothetical protein
MPNAPYPHRKNSLQIGKGCLTKLQRTIGNVTLLCVTLKADTDRFDGPKTFLLPNAPISHDSGKALTKRRQPGHCCSGCHCGLCDDQIAVHQCKGDAAQ